MSVRKGQEHCLRGVGFLNKHAAALRAKGPLLTGRGALRFRSVKIKDPAPQQQWSLWGPWPHLALSLTAHEPAVFSQSLVRTPSFIWNVTSLRLWKLSLFTC